MISVIVPAYNDGRYIAACLDSILSQKEVSLEILAIDDGSTDDTRSVLEDYASRNNCIKIFCLDHKDPPAARNLALDHCSGDWIAMVDGDDILMPGALKLMVDAAEANPGTDLVMGRFCVVKDDAVVSTPRKPMLKLLYGDEAAEMMMYKSRHADIVNSSACGKLFRRKLWTYLRFTEGMLYEDLEIVPRVCFGVRQVAVIGGNVYGYRRNPSGTIHTFDRSHADMVKATSRLCGFFAHEPRLLKAARSRHFSALFNMMLRIRSNCLDMPDMEAECRKELRALAPGQMFARKVRMKNRIGAVLQYFPILLKSPGLCKLFVTK